jgi:hypothetical protein
MVAVSTKYEIVLPQCEADPHPGGFLANVGVYGAFYATALEEVNSGKLELANAYHSPVHFQ